MPMPSFNLLPDEGLRVLDAGPDGIVFEALRPIAVRLETTIPAIVLAWTMCRAGISSVLFGATTPSQVAENTPGLTCQLDAAAFTAIDDAYRARGPVASRRAVR